MLEINTKPIYYTCVSEHEKSFWRRMGMTNLNIFYSAILSEKLCIRLARYENICIQLLYGKRKFRITTTLSYEELCKILVLESIL